MSLLRNGFCGIRIVIETAKTVKNAGCLGVELAAQVQEIIASNTCSCAEKEIVRAIRACLSPL